MKHEVIAMNAKKIGLFLKEKRISNNVTQVQLAEKLGVTHQAVSRWETGESIPDVIMLDKLSLLYGVSIDTILQRSKDENISENNKKTDFTFFSLLSIMAYLFTLVVSYFSYSEVADWLWLLLVVGLSILSTLPFLVPYYLAQETNRPLTLHRYILDGFVVTIGISILLALSQLNTIDIENIQLYYYIYIPLWLMMISIIDYATVYSHKPSSIGLKEEISNGLKNKNIYTWVILTLNVIGLITVVMIYPLLHTEQFHGIFSIIYWLSAFIIIGVITYRFKPLYVIFILGILSVIISHIYNRQFYGLYPDTVLDINALYRQIQPGTNISVFPVLTILLFAVIYVFFNLFKHHKVDKNILLFTLYVFLFFGTNQSIQSIDFSNGYIQANPQVEYGVFYRSEVFPLISLILIVSTVIIIYNIYSTKKETH